MSLIRADARFLPLADKCVQCVVTSPPYFGLRDYGTARWEGGSADCDHRQQLGGEGAASKKQNTSAGTQTLQYRGVCGRCGAERVDRQIGLEPSPDAYVAELVAVFREVRRVLKDDGTVWLNLGDSYNNSDKWGGGGVNTGKHTKSVDGEVPSWSGVRRRWSGIEGIKPKDLLGIPWRVAFALQADGWYLRSDIIWSKPNPMPESVTDRPTKAHEYLFLLAKGQSRVRRVAFSDLNPERVHFGLNFGKQAAGTDVVQTCVSLASSFFYCAQSEDNFSLPPFYSEVWKQRAQDAASDLGSRLPPIQRLAAHAARLLNADASTKEFLCEIQRIWCDLRQHDHLLIGRSMAKCAHAPSILVDGDTAIAVNDAGKVRKIEFLHGSIIDTVSTTCNYYYDADAIGEPVSGAMLDQMEQGYDGLGLKDYESAGVQNPSGVKARIIANARKKALQSGVTGSTTTAEFLGEPAEAESVRVGPEGPLKSGRTGGRKPDKFDRLICGAGRSGVGENLARRNRRTVWTIPTMPYAGAHFATMPEKLVEPCILAGSRLGDRVLDPFIGSGTVGAVAERLGRRWVGTDLNAAYHALARKRTAQRGIPFEATA